MVGIVSIILLDELGGIFGVFTTGRQISEDGTKDYRFEVSFYSRNYIPV